MGIDERNLQVIYIDLDVIVESCPITINIVILNLLAYKSTIQYSNIAII